MTLKEAIQITGGLSRTSKMPCASWGISPSKCLSGSQLRLNPLTTCAQCYACKGRYRGPNVEQAHEKRYQGISHPLWVQAMVMLILNEKNPFFRWFDSGDIQGYDHLGQIYQVCEYTPGVKHWLPTQELELVKQFYRHHPRLPNLTIRISSVYVNQRRMPVDTDGKSFPISLTVTNKRDVTCPARNHGNTCGDCRKCWSADEPAIAYELH